MGVFETIGVNDYINEESREERVYLQFWLGHVLFSITSRESPHYTSPKDINAVLVAEHIDTDMSQGKLGNKFFPLLRGIHDTPTAGDQVLLCQFGGENYYIGPVNTLNKPNYNVDQVFKIAQSIETSDKVEFKKRWGIPATHKISNLARLEKKWISELDNPEDEYGDAAEKMSGEDYTKIHNPGDMVFEGRYGNSIRLGARNANPNIIISNGRTKQNISPTVSLRETLTDTGIISMTSQGKLNDHYSTVFVPSCNVKDLNKPDTTDNPRLVEYDTEYNKGQLTLVSQKIILDSRRDSLLLSSFAGVDIGSSANINLKAKERINLDGLVVNLGTKDTATEPVVLGKELVNWLKQLCTQIQAMTMTVVAPPGPTGPALNASAFATLSGQLDVILSKYAFVQKDKGKS